MEVEISETKFGTRSQIDPEVWVLENACEGRILLEIRSSYRAKPAYALIPGLSIFAKPHWIYLSQIHNQTE